MAGIKWFINAVKDRIFPPNYSPKEYWEKRLKENFNLIGVGNKRLSEKKNRELYKLKEKIILDVFNKICLNVKDIAVADIGCGIGFWTGVFKNYDCKNYFGIDISESAIEKLKKLYPAQRDYRFVCAEISELVIEEKFDLVFMIDVTQHIVNDEKFRKSMEFIKSILKNDGYFFVTSWLKDELKNTYYEKSRSIEYYKSNFPDFNFSEPVPFNDKFLMVISKNPTLSLK